MELVMEDFNFHLQFPQLSGRKQFKLTYNDWSIM